MASKPQEPAHFFYTGELEQLAGITKHMVNYLCRHGLLTASASENRGYGKRRRFSFTDVLLARTIRQFLDADVSVLSMRTTLLELRRHLHSDSPATLRDKRIVIRGGTPYLLQADEAPVDLLAKGQMAFGFVLEIEELWRKAQPIGSERESSARERIQRAVRLKKERLA